MLPARHSVAAAAAGPCPLSPSRKERRRDGGTDGGQIEVSECSCSRVDAGADGPRRRRRRTRRLSLTPTAAAAACQARASAAPAMEKRASSAAHTNGERNIVQLKSSEG